MILERKLQHCVNIQQGGYRLLSKTLPVRNRSIRRRKLVLQRVGVISYQGVTPVRVPLSLDLTQMDGSLLLYQKNFTQMIGDRS
jgi:hypothetical protein